MTEARRKVDADLRGCAVRLVWETGRPIAAVARDLTINEGTLGNWVNAVKRHRADLTAATRRCAICVLQTQARRQPSPTSPAPRSAIYGLRIRYPQHSVAEYISRADGVRGSRGR